MTVSARLLFRTMNAVPGFEVKEATVYQSLTILQARCQELDPAHESLSFVFHQEGGGDNENHFCHKGAQRSTRENAFFV